MRLVIPILVGLLLLVGSVGALSLDFQNANDFNSVVFYGAGGSWANSATGQNSYILLSSTGTVENAQPLQSTYFAFTRSEGSVINIQVSDVSHGSLWATSTTGSGRYEVKMIGGAANLFINGVLIGSSGTLSTNPSYISIQSLNPGVTVDDLIVGSADSPYIFGMPKQNAWVIQKDFANPASSGFAHLNGVIINSNNMTTTFSKNNGDNESIFLANTESGTIYATEFTGSAYTGSIVWPLGNIFNTTAPFGNYRTYSSNGTGFSVSIPYISNGATIFFDSHTYNQGDTATMTYAVSNAPYWNTSGYDYKVYLRDIYGATVQNFTVTTQTGTKQYTWTSANAQNVYYAIMIATPKAGGSEVWMGYDYTTLQAYFAIHGYVNNGPNATPINVSYLNITQGGIIDNITTIDGNYTASGFFTGSAIQINVTAPGYRQYNVSFTPMEIGSKYVNITLAPISVIETGASIGGVAHNGVLTGGYTITNGYGQPVPSATVTTYNGTATYTKTTNNAGWYLCDNGASCMLAPSSPYTVNGSKAGYTNSTNYAVNTPAGATSFTQQDIWLQQQYTLTVHVVDSSGLVIPNAMFTDSVTGAATNTTTGTLSLTYPFGAVAYVISSSGYSSKAGSVFVDNDTAITVQLTTATPNANQNTWWTPHTVQITLMDAAYGFRLTDVGVNATYNETSMPTGWIQSLYGIQSGVSADMINKTLVLGGITGSDGTLTTTMLGSIKYDIYLTSATYGLNNYHVQAYPSDSMLNIYVATAGSVLPTNKNSTYISLNGTRVYVTEPDIYNVSMCIDYQDSSGSTTSVTDTWMFQNNDTVISTSTFSPGTLLNTSCYTLPNIRGTRVFWGWNSTRSVM